MEDVVAKVVRKRLSCHTQVPTNGAAISEIYCTTDSVSQETFFSAAATAIFNFDFCRSDKVESIYRCVERFFWMYMILVHNQRDMVQFQVSLGDGLDINQPHYCVYSLFKS